MGRAMQEMQGVEETERSLRRRRRSKRRRRRRALRWARRIGLYVAVPLAAGALLVKLLIFILGTY
jgi:hypothetical protein